MFLPPVIPPSWDELHFLRLGEMFVYIFNEDKWPCQIISVSDYLKPCGFCWEPHCCMEIPNGWFNAWDIVDIVDGFFHIVALVQEYLQMV